MNNCAFCGPTKSEMSGEDFWPRWFSKWVRRTYGTKRFRHVEVRNTGSQNTEVSQRINFQIPVVCLECNNEWMSRAENAAKPILTKLIEHPSRTHTLTVHERKAIALWMAIKSVILDHLFMEQGGSTKPFFTPQQRTHMRVNEAPPKQIDVYVGRIEKMAERPSGSHRTAYLVNFPGKSAKHLRAFIVTIFANELILQLVASRMSKANIPMVPVPFAYKPVAGDWTDYAPRIWPSNGDVIYPPTRLLTPGVLAFRFGGYPDEYPPSFLAKSSPGHAS